MTALLNSRLSRYALAVSAVAAATPAQAAPITVLLPTPVSLAGITVTHFDVDQSGGFDITFSGGFATAFFPYFPLTANFGASGSAARPLSLGVLIDRTVTGGFWGTGSAGVSFNTAVSPTFLAIRFGSAATGPQRVGFAQFSGSNLYGFAWDEANTITTFDITAPPTAVPEPATGALTALALGAVALAARKRKQA